PTSADAADPAEGKFKGEDADVVLANPPFGTVREEDGRNKIFSLDDIQTNYQTDRIDHAIALRALEGMADDGRAVLLLGGIGRAETEEARAQGYQSKVMREFYKALKDRYNITDHFTVSGDLYERQGAAWPVDVVVIDGRGKSDRPMPAAMVPKVYKSWDELKG